jgi:hypothetical protein
MVRISQALSLFLLLLIDSDDILLKFAPSIINSHNEDLMESLPIPNVLVGYQDDWIR